MSKLNNVSIHTLRYYDEIGLLKPSSVNEDTQYRYYDEYDCSILFKIKIFRELGMPLKKIKDLLSGSIFDVEEALISSKEEVNSKLQRLEDIKSYLDAQLEFISELKSGEHEIEPKLVKFDDRIGYYIDVDSQTSDKERIEALARFEKSKSVNPDVYFQPSRLMDLNAQGETNLKSFLAIDNYNHKNKWGDSVLIDGGTYGVIDHIGRYRDINLTYKKLIEFSHSQGYEICGEAIEILFITSSILSNSDVRRIQLQVRLKVKND